MTCFKGYLQHFHNVILGIEVIKTTVTNQEKTKAVTVIANTQATASEATIIGGYAKAITFSVTDTAANIAGANTDALSDYIGFRPRTSIEEGIDSFVSWYKDFYSR